MRWLCATTAMMAAVVAAGAGCERASTTARPRTEDARATSDAPRAEARSSDGSAADEGGRYGREDAAPRRARQPTPDFHGEPLWSDNRRYSAQENATYHCDKSGPDIGARSLDDCLTKVHAFIDHPPSGVETLTRPNGDKLMYDGRANLFVVARRDGAPRTFFKPRTGAAYWREQKARVASGDDGYARRRAGAGADEGSGA